MLREKRRDLDAEKRKDLLQRFLSELTHSRPDLYYQATSEVARHLKDYIGDGATINAEERALLERLSSRDIEVLLGLH